MHKSKRLGVLAAAAAGAVLTAGLSSAAIPSDGEIVFEILRDSADIGSHKLSFRREGEDLHVNVAIDIEVGFGLLTLFEYTHTNHEVWRDGRLIRLESTTNDDGDEYIVSAKLVGETLRVEATGQKPYDAPADIIPTSYWHPHTVTQSRLLNTQTGRIVQIMVQPQGEDRILVGGEQHQATKFRVSGDLEMQLWYDPSGDPTGQLLKLAFSARGSKIDLRREQPAGKSETLQAFRSTQ
jgi:hypothetical protein